MEGSYTRTDRARPLLLPQTQEVGKLRCAFPSKGVICAVAIIVSIGSLVAAGVFYSSLGPSSLYFLTPVPVAGLLAAAAICCSKRGQTGMSYIKLGSPDNPLDMNQIRETLAGLTDTYKDRKGGHQADALIIYGNADVEIYHDPGFLHFDPKKIILVGGARIIHAPSEFIRLDDILCEKGWLSNTRRAYIKGANPHHSTYVKQIEVHTVDEAMQHKPEKGAKAVYRVLTQ